MSVNIQPAVEVFSQEYQCGVPAEMLITLTNANQASRLVASPESEIRFDGPACTLSEPALLIRRCVAFGVSPRRARTRSWTPRQRPHCSAMYGLVLVDLRKTDPARLETYMGKEGVSRFLEHHGASVAASR